MEQTPFELTPEQQSMLASLSRETGKPIPTLIAKALEELQEHERSGHDCDTTDGHETPAPVVPPQEAPKTIWEIFEEASRNSNRSGCENRNHAAACDFWSLLGSRDGAASPRKAASCAAVRYSKTLRCCCFNVATTVIMLATKREPSSL